jgi:ABC-type multidrug transport system fused ATPase/permease subunit
MYKIFYVCVILFILSGCVSTPDPKKVTDRITGKEYTLDEWAALTADEKEEIREGNKDVIEDRSVTDRLLSEPIVIIYAVGALIFIGLTVLCFWMASSNPKMFWGAMASAAGAVLCIAAPVITLLFIQAGKIILFALVGVVSICSIMIILWLWRKLHKSDNAGETLVKSVDHLLEFVPEDKIEDAKKGLKNIQGESRNLVDKLIAKAK